MMNDINSGSLKISENHVSTTALPLAISQVLWHWDLHRLVNDGAGTNLLGFSKPSGRSSMETVKQLSERPPRTMQLKWLAQLFVLSGDEASCSCAATKHCSTSSFVFGKGAPSGSDSSVVR